METRLASAADAGLLAALHAESFGSARWTEAQFADSLALATSEAWIVLANGTPQGFILCQFVEGDAEILTLCVTPLVRRKGIARHLLATLVAAAHQRNAQHVFLEVAVDNRAALALYKAEDFQPAGKRANYYRRDGRLIDAVMLRLDL